MHGPTCVFWANLPPYSRRGGAHLVAHADVVLEGEHREVEVDLEVRRTLVDDGLGGAGARRPSGHPRITPHRQHQYYHRQFTNSLSPWPPG
jgi:hypothetical protein